MEPRELAKTALTMDPTGSPWEVGSLARKAAEQTETIGERLSRLRRERGITQVELATRLGIAQPVISDYERGELRLHGQLIVDLSNILGVTADELLGLEKPKTAAALKNRRLLRQLQELDRLSKRDQQAVARMLDGFLQGRLAS